MKDAEKSLGGQLRFALPSAFAPAACWREGRGLPDH